MPVSPEVNLSLLERLGAVPGSFRELTEIKEITQAIRSAVPPAGYFFDLSNCGVLYFLSARRNPTRFGVVEFIQGDRMRVECLQALLAHPPQAVLAQESTDGLACRIDLLPIRDYILQHYHPWKRVGSWVLLVPK